MGVYLTIIGSSDRVYHGVYLWHDHGWRNSTICSLADFLSLVSSEVSALIMCLITLDRFLVLRFPFSRLHFGVVSAHMAAAVVWLLGLLLASVPLEMPHWQFYSHTGICIPLPILRSQFPGPSYAFGTVIVFNLFLFLFICVGKVVIYWSVRVNAMSLTNTSKKIKELTIARRLITVAMSDFLCWFPIGLLGLLASRGVPIPSEVYVVVAVFVLPLNSALNPFFTQSTSSWNAGKRPETRN